MRGYVVGTLLLLMFPYLVMASSADDAANQAAGAYDNMTNAYDSFNQTEFRNHIDDVLEMFNDPSTTIIVLWSLGGTATLGGIGVLIKHYRELSKAPKNLAMRAHYLAIVQVNFLMLATAGMSIFAWKAGMMFKLLRAIYFQKLLSNFLSVLDILVHDHAHMEGGLAAIVEMAEGFEHDENDVPTHPKNAVIPLAPKVKEKTEVARPTEGSFFNNNDEDVEAGLCDKDKDDKKQGCFGHIFHKYAVKAGLGMARQSMFVVPFIEVFGQYILNMYNYDADDTGTIDVMAVATALSVLLSCVWITIIMKPFKKIISSEWNLNAKTIGIILIMFAIGIQPVIVQHVRPDLPGLSKAASTIIWDNFLILIWLTLATIPIRKGFRFHDFLMGQQQLVKHASRMSARKSGGKENPGLLF